MEEPDEETVRLEPPWEHSNKSMFHTIDLVFLFKHMLQNSDETTKGLESLTSSFDVRYICLFIFN